MLPVAGCRLSVGDCVEDVGQVVKLRTGCRIPGLIVVKSLLQASKIRTHDRVVDRALVDEASDPCQNLLDP